MSQLYEAHNDIVSLLPVKIYRHKLEGNYIYSPLHFHRSIELTVTLTGNIRFIAGSNNFDFKESDWLLINSCELHSCRFIAPSDSFIGISILFSLPFCFPHYTHKMWKFLFLHKKEVTKKPPRFLNYSSVFSVFSVSSTVSVVSTFSVGSSLLTFSASSSFS